MSESSPSERGGLHYHLYAMLVTLDDRQMLQLWREGAGLEPALDDASVERFDAINIDMRLLTAMRAWYIDCLTNAPSHLVPVTDLSEWAELDKGPSDDTWTLSLICECARITDIAVENVGLLSLVSPDDTRAVTALRNRFVRHGCQPVALYRNGERTAILNIRSRQRPSLRYVRGVMIPEDDIYTVDERMLAAIPPLARKVLYDDSSLSLNTLS